MVKKSTRSRRSWGHYRPWWIPIQYKNPELYNVPLPKKKYRSKPVVKVDSFKKASPKVITRVGSW